jgi:sulfotransferase family protein
MIDNKPMLAYFGHHKCGSTMILRVVEKLCHYTGLRHAHFHSPKMWGYHNNSFTLDCLVENLGLDFVSYISADIKYIGDKQRYRGIHVVRDPRDIVVSSYFSHRYSHPTDHWPELIEFRKLLGKLPEDEGLLENMKFTAKLRVDGWDLNFFDTLIEWDYSMSNVMEVKFEDLVANPYQIFLAMFEFLGLVDDTDMLVSGIKSLLRYKLQSRHPHWLTFKKIDQIPAWMLFSFVHANRFAKLAGGRDQGQEDVRSHYRRGTPGDWKNHFNDQHKNFFKDYYNDLLIKLGYEKDDNW